MSYVNTIRRKFVHISQQLSVSGVLSLYPKTPRFAHHVTSAVNGFSDF